MAGSVGERDEKIVGGRVQRGDGGRKREGGKQVDGWRFMNRNNVRTDG